MRVYSIVMLAPFGIRPKGTLAVRMLPLAQALVRRGHRVVILAPPVQNPQDGASCRSYVGVPVIHTAATPAGAVGMARHVLALLHLARLGRPDVIHLFKPKGYSGLAARLNLLLAAPAPLVVDSDDWEGRGGWNDVLPYPGWARMLFNWQEHDLPQQAQTVTVASRTLQTQMWGLGMPPERVIYLPNGIARTALHAPAPSAVGYPPTMLLYTRFWEFTVADMITTLVAIHQAHPTARLLVVGKGERGEEHQLLHLAERAGVAAMIDYRGWVEPAQIPDLLARADMALVPIDDTLINRARCSVKLLELMAYGLPLVVSRVGEVNTYLTDGQSALLVPPSDPVAMARAALLLLTDTDLRRQLSQGAQQALRPFVWDNLVERAEHAYAQALVGG